MYKKCNKTASQNGKIKKKNAHREIKELLAQVCDNLNNILSWKSRLEPSEEPDFISILKGPTISSPLAYCSEESITLKKDTHENSHNTIGSKHRRKYYIIPKFSAALDRSQLSQRDTMFVNEATTEALRHELEDLTHNKNFIQRQ